MNDLIPLLYIAAVIVAIFVVYTIYRNSIDNGKKLDLILKILKEKDNNEQK